MYCFSGIFFAKFYENIFYFGTASEAFFCSLSLFEDLHKEPPWCFHLCISIFLAEFWSVFISLHEFNKNSSNNNNKKYVSDLRIWLLIIHSQLLLLNTICGAFRAREKKMNFMLAKKSLKWIENITERCSEVRQSFSKTIKLARVFYFRLKNYTKISTRR